MTNPPADAVAPPLQPIIPGCTPFKYYRVPDGLKRLRRKQKVGIIFGYVGECYCGLQWNHLPEYPTVEEALMKALFETDMVSEVNFSNFKVQQLLNFERASRTDKGVHALRNVVSVALMLPYDPAYVRRHAEAVHGSAGGADTTNNNVKDDGEGGDDGDGLGPVFSCEEAARLLNEALPADIHVYAVVPVTRSFNAYLNCGGRRYEYYLPTFSLMTQPDYSTTYFPPSLAPSQPTLAEVGFVPGKHGKPNATRTTAPLTDEEEEARRRRQKNSARKSKGHFPKRKKAKAAARAAAAAATQAEHTAPPTSTTTTAATSEGEVVPTAPSEVAAAAAVVVADEAELDGQESEAESEDSEAEVQAVLERAAENRPYADNYATHFHDGLFETMILFRTIPAEAMRRAAGYRIPAAQLEHVRRLFHTYEGTHCYHNFTPGGRSHDASCHRFLRSVTVSDPFVVSPQDALLQHSIDQWSLNRFYSPDERVAATYEEWLSERDAAAAAAAGVDAAPGQERRHVSDDVDAALRERMRRHISDVYVDGVEVVRIELDGQSFMLNQIRKMIGAVVCIAAAGLPDDHICDVLLRKGVRRGIPMAPANGLFLSYLDFSGYNRRLERIQTDGNNGAGKGALDVEAGVDAGEVEAQRRRIVAVVLRNEMAEDIMGKWMRSLRHVLRLAWRHDLE
ncbi:tRNA pseudouridine synthase [Novymonas esmeraldas]|uniref:tRNA pseudouridine synthase n=1 Tax=Novymonas esmeraldas TaxID=1808958 RepID=A0AAW0ER80_9TRYP